MNPREIPKLSKSRFVAGLQCPLRLWHLCYNPDLAPKVSPVQQAGFQVTTQKRESKEVQAI
ncbi:MAG: hypothetical protein KAT27_03835 [Desulfobacterales bacterium]|nr:hypothetical protein [Desulfobacterales bacterium]